MVPELPRRSAVPRGTLEAVSLALFVSRGCRLRGLDTARFTRAPTRVRQEVRNRLPVPRRRRDERVAREGHASSESRFMAYNVFPWSRWEAAGDSCWLRCAGKRCLSRTVDHRIRRDN